MVLEHPLAKRILKALVGKNRVSLEDLVNTLKENKDAITKFLFWLEEEGYIKLEKKRVKKYELTERGKIELREGLPEEELLTLYEEGIRDVRDLRNNQKAKIAIGLLKKKGLLSIKDGKIFLDVEDC